MAWSDIIIISLLTVSLVRGYTYKIGVGIADLTGPPAEVAFMGYAHPDQIGRGIHLRQFARSFIIDDGKTRLVFVSADCGMMGTYVRQEVIRKLSAMYGKLYNEDNVMLSGTHTHSTPGGFLMDIIFDLNSLGFVKETFEAYVNGITRSIVRAHSRMSQGNIYLTRGEVLNASINRSPTAYMLNPAKERAKYTSNTDKTFAQLKFVRRDGLPLGVVTWFAVHPTSMNNTNRLVSSDNVGYASVLFEKKMNSKYTKLIGKGPFVAAFASTNLGDVSPNIKGGLCHKSGRPCDAATSSCEDKSDKCIAFGPGRDIYESTSIIANRILDKAWEAWKTDGTKVEGPIGVVHQYVHMPSQKVPYVDPRYGNKSMVSGCLPAMGYSFAAGTTDGPGAFSFKQGTTSTNPLWNAVTNLIAPPSKEQIQCQAPKPILLSTGEMNFPFEWQPSVVSTQLGKIGQVAIACVPGEFTTMSGRRLRNVLSKEMGLKSPNQVIVAGLCNTYSDYITTPEEYQAQRYEAASTIFGPYTLPIYLEQYRKLAQHLNKGTWPNPGPPVPESFSDVISLLPGVVFDNAGWKKEFGDVILQPPTTARIGETVITKFVSGNPRNGLHQEGSYLTVEKLGEGDQWEIIATDANWETIFIWERISSILGTSRVEIRWTIPKDTVPGTYRIRHFGHYKYVYGRIEPYSGVTQAFKVVLN